MSSELVTVSQFFVPKVVTTRQLALEPISVPMCVPHFGCCDFRPKFCDNPSACSGSNCPKCCCSNFCDHPSAQFCDHPSFRSTPNFLSKCSYCRTNFCPLHLVHFAVSRPQLTTRTSKVHLTLKCCLRALDGSRLRRCQQSCRWFPYRVSPQVSAPIVCPKVIPSSCPPVLCNP